MELKTAQKQELNATARLHRQTFSTLEKRMGLTANKLLRADWQDAASKKAGGMSTDSGDRLLELAVSQPRPQPLHVAVTQQAACVEDTENRQVMKAALTRVIV